MGMLATRIIANEIYNINKLYHFTDEYAKDIIVIITAESLESVRKLLVTVHR